MGPGPISLQREILKILLKKKAGFPPPPPFFSKIYQDPFWKFSQEILHGKIKELKIPQLKKNFLGFFWRFGPPLTQDLTKKDFFPFPNGNKLFFQKVFFLGFFDEKLNFLQLKTSRPLEKKKKLWPPPFGGDARPPPQKGPKSLAFFLPNLPVSWKIFFKFKGFFFFQPFSPELKNMFFLNLSFSFPQPKQTTGGRKKWKKEKKRKRKKLPLISSPGEAFLETPLN